MYRIVLILSAITLVCSIAESLLDDNTQLAVNGICKQTTDTKFCGEVFANKLINSSPSKKDLVNVTVTEAERFSANTYFLISTLLRNDGDERPKSANDSGKILDLNDNFSASVGICKTDFIAPGYETNPMIEKETMVLMAMQKIVVHMVSS
ncbi:hypothetical protein Bca4012_097034 [Brassica carinata]|uniref:Pectinesterase inhibitor domain-containing protein n=2 Tax=Brassica TaxID=3705 RepID=A0ABQ7YFN7_BRANA|nr:uncharacterized protein BNAC08G50000D [Brassica napus]KAG2260057.1 hypothetical protein Bca52824_079351 [Brassica carinata]KAH0866534.1 hypothetical protein HID58_083745 [Brassica napus]